MEVILTESVINLGNLGDIVNVANGYYRNYLGPQSKAIANNKANQELFKTQLKDLEKRAAEVKKQAESEAKKLKNLKLELKARVVSNDKLYGSISIHQINQLLQDADVIVPKNAIVLNQTIRYLGTFNINIKLHPDIEVTLPLKVTSDAPIEESHHQDEAASDADDYASDEASYTQQEKTQDPAADEPTAE